MSQTDLEQCPGCGVHLPQGTEVAHRYIGATSGCWDIYSNLLNAGEPPLAPHPMNCLIVDAYAAQHPGTPSPQSIQSVAVHLLALYGVLVKNVSPENVLWIRRRALRLQGAQSKHARFEWLTPPDELGRMTIVDVIEGSTPTERTELAGRYVETVWDAWQRLYLEKIGQWYEDFVIPDRL